MCVRVIRIEFFRSVNGYQFSYEGNKGSFDSILVYLIILYWIKIFCLNLNPCRGREKYVIDDSLSSSVSLDCEVPQCYVLGSALFTLYTKYLGNLVAKHNLQHQFYANDSQLFDSLKPPVTSGVVVTSNMSTCCDEVKAWTTTNNF